MSLKTGNSTIPALEILERITDGFLAFDREWRFTFVNAAAERIVRRPRADLLGQVLWEEYSDVVGTPIEETYRRAMGEQVPLTLETYYEPLDLYVTIHAYPSRTGLSVYLQDVTESKRQAAALAESEARYRRIVETAYEGIWWADADYRTVWCNQRMADVLGYASPADLIGRTVPDFVYREDLPELRRRMAERRAGVAAQYDIRMQRADGGVMWVLARIAPVLDDEGRFLGALGMLTDITERKHFERELFAQREWFRVTLSSIGDAVIVTDEQGRISFANAVAERLTGWPQHEALGVPLDEVFRIVNEHTRQPVESPVEKVLRLGTVVGLANHTVLLRRDGSELPIDDSGAPIRDDRGDIAGVVLVFRDNTERRQTELQLLEADRRKDEFLAVLSHELRNPLAPIRSALDLMRMKAEDPGAVTRAREVVERQVEHMRRLVDDLLDVSRITRGKINLRRERVELASVVARAVETVRPLITEKKQNLHLDLPREPIALEIDPTRVAQVIGNLLHNASKFTPVQGHIELLAERCDSELVLRVRDDGVGISPESLPRIFDTFAQAEPSLDRSYGGLGIGLTLVRSLVELHGGRVQALSDGRGRGTEIMVTLPTAVGAVADEAASGPPDARNVARRRVLVVDDNADAAETLGLLLTALGHETRVMHDGQSALEQVRREPPDVALLDIRLPQISGYDLARQMRGDPALKELKLVALTGYGHEGDQRRSTEAGFDVHLVKPVDLETISKVLAQLFKGSR